MFNECYTLEESIPLTINVNGMKSLKKGDRALSEQT